MKKRSLILALAALHIGVMAYAMNTEVTLPSAEILKTYLADNKRLLSLNEDISKKFGDKTTSPEAVKNFIWEKIDEKMGEFLYMSIGKDINNIVKLTFKDHPELLGELIKAKQLF